MSESRIIGSPTPFDDEHSLVSAAQKGDQRAFEELYSRYNQKMCRHIKSFVRDDAITSELVQDTFEAAWRSLSSLRDPSCFSSWLFRIATNFANSYLRRRKKFLFVSLEDWHEQGGESTTVDPESRVVSEELIRQALASVNPTYRTCFILYYIEEFPQKMIASIVQIREARVSVYVSRGAEQFRKAYARLSQLSKEEQS